MDISTEKTRIEKDTCTPMFTATVFTIARTWKQPRCPTDELLKKLWDLNTMEYFSAIKRNTFDSVVMTWMNLDHIIQSEVKSEREKQRGAVPRWQRNRTGRPLSPPQNHQKIV